MLNKGKNAKMLFLGDYVDRGPNSKECVYIIERFPNNVFALAGNHEGIAGNEEYNFKTSLKQMKNSTYESCVNVFKHLSLGTTINNTIFACHSGGWGSREEDIGQIYIKQLS